MSGPLDVLDHSDTGDETLRRFRYQINYCALKALQLLITDAELVAIYCEHHEDVLLEMKDGSLIAIQIKTRELHQPHLKASDDAIYDALVKFCRKDAEFPNKISSFVLVTNFAFYRGNGAGDIQNLINEAKKSPALEGLTERSQVKQFFKTLSKKTGLSMEAVVGTFARIALEERKTGIDQPDLEVTHAIGEFPHYRDLPPSRVLSAARALRWAIFEASSRSLQTAIAKQHEITTTFNDLRDALYAAKKRICQTDLESILKDAAAAVMASGEAELLSIAQFLRRDEIAPGLGRMILKMQAGEIPLGEIDQMKDDVSTLDSAFIKWKERYGLEEANRRLAHFQHLALRDLRKAKSATESAPDPYGHPMLKAFRNIAEQTHQTETATLFGCRPEHLIGTGGVLTDECKIWWGPEIPIGDKKK